MVTEPPRFPTIEDVLGDSLRHSNGGANIALVRQRVIVRLLQQIPVPQETMFKLWLQLVQHGVLDHVEWQKEIAASMGIPVSPPSQIVPYQSQPNDAGGPVATTKCQMWPGGMQTRFEQEFERVQLLGRGAFGEVWRCRHRVDGHEYAVKAVQYRISDARGIQLQRRVQREAQTWAGMNHPHVVRYHNAWIEDEWIPASNTVGLFAKPCGGVVAPLPLPAPCSHTLEPSEPSMPEASILAASYNDESSSGIEFAEATETQSQCAAEDKEDKEDSSPVPTLNAVPLSPTLSVHTSPPTSPAMLNVFQGVGTDGSRLITAADRPLEYRGTLYIQTELCLEKTLQTWIHNRNASLASGKTTAKDRQKLAREAFDIFRQCVSAVDYLHSRGCAHRDVKPANIFFSEDGGVRLGDFGLAKVLEQPDEPTARGCLENFGGMMAFSNQTRNIGTPSYASPEQLTGNSYGIETDIYALGVILTELLCPVQTQMERAKLLEGLRHGHVVPTKAAEAFPKLARLATDMTHAEPSERPTSQEVMQKTTQILHEVRSQLGESSHRASGGGASSSATSTSAGRIRPFHSSWRFRAGRQNSGITCGSSPNQRSECGGSGPALALRRRRYYTNQPLAAST